MPKEYVGRQGTEKMSKPPIKTTQGEGSPSDSAANGTASQKGTVAATEEDGEDAESDSHPMPAGRGRTVPQRATDRGAGSLAKRLLAKALWYASVGAKVIPLAPGSKRPLTKHGLKDATDDPEQIKAWWAKYPTANIGIRTGRESGIVVLDVDVKNGAKGMESLAKLEEEYGPFPTLWATTPTGGRHYFFLAPDCRVPNRTNLLPGIDVRGDDGYIVVSPSEVDGNSYDWEDEDADIAELSEALLEFLTSKGRKKGGAPVRTTAGNSEEHTGVKEGSRNDHVFRAACRFNREGMSYEEARERVLQVAANCDPPLPEDEALRCLESAWRYDDHISQLNREYFVVPVGGRVHIASEKFDPVTGMHMVHLGDEQGFRLLNAHWFIVHRTEDGKEKRVLATDLWIRSKKRRQYKGIVFAPGRETPGWYNLWMGFSVEPVQGDSRPFWKHLYFVICQKNKEHYWYFRRWLAHMIQRPDELPGVAIVIRGGQGNGKSSFIDLIADLVRQHYFVLDSMEQLTGRFTGHFRDKILVYANEAVWAGNKAGEGALKALITDTVIPVEEKFKDVINVRNYKRLIVTTNKPWAVPMEADDRRFLVLEAGDQRKENTEYFAALVHQMREEGGLQAVMYDLLNEDLTEFNVRKKPASRHAVDIKLRSAEPIVAWWHECLRDGDMGISDDIDRPEDAWPQSPLRDWLYHSFISFCTTHGQRTLSRELFGRELRKMLPGGRLGECRPGSVDPDTGHRRRHRAYVLPSLVECRQAFEAFFHAGEELWE